MSDAERNVTIRLNIVPGDIQKPDVSWLTTAGKEAVALVPELKSIADTTKEVVEANKSLVEVTKEVERTSKLNTGVEKESIETSRKASKERIQIAKNEQQEIAKIRRPISEPSSRIPGGFGGGPNSPNGPNGPNGPKGPKTDLSGIGDQILAESIANIDAVVAAQEKANSKTEADAEKSKAKLLKDEEAWATAMAKSRDALNQQRVREDTKVAKQAEMAAKKLPMLHKKIEHGILGSVAATSKLALNLSMLSQSGGKDTEALAKSFVQVQAKIGTVTEAYSTIKSVGGTLSALQKAGKLTESMVASQKLLGVATTFSQSATIGLASAAATAQAALGPIALIAGAIAGALVIAHALEEAYAETEEDIAKKKEARLKRWDELQKHILSTMENQKIIMAEETEQLNEQWEIKRLLLGDQKMTVAERSKEREEKRTQAMQQVEQNFGIRVGEMQHSPERAQREQKLKMDIEDKFKKVQEQEKDIKSWEDGWFGFTETTKGVVMHKKNTLDKLKDEVKEAEDALANNSFSEGDKQFERLRATKFKNGEVVDKKQFDQDMSALPPREQAKMAELLKATNADRRKVLQVDAGALPEMRREMESARVSLPQLERDLIQNGQFGAQENLAARFNTTEGANAKQQALASIERFRAGDVNQKQYAIDSIREQLGSERTSPEMEGLLEKGTNATADELSKQLIDDAEINDLEKTQSKENYDKLKQTRDEAIDVQLNMAKEIKAIEEIIKSFKLTVDGFAQAQAVANSI